MLCYSHVRLLQHLQIHLEEYHLQVQHSSLTSIYNGQHFDNKNITKLREKLGDQKTFLHPHYL